MFAAEKTLDTLTNGALRSVFEGGPFVGQTLEFSGLDDHHNGTLKRDVCRSRSLFQSRCNLKQDAPGYGKRFIVHPDEMLTAFRETAKGDTRVRGEFNLVITLPAASYNALSTGNCEKRT